MEYTIYSESLIYYALRGEKGYLCFHGGRYEMSFNMNCLYLFNSVQKAEKAKVDFEDAYSKLSIRKVKVIDIGEVNES